jgi:DNA polymerase III delta prime subunit
MQNINQKNIDILKKYIELSLSSDQKISFFLLSWPKGIWKSQIAEDLSQDFLLNYFRNDFLHIKDFSSELWKSHNIKVAQKDDETYKTLYSDHNYQDIWTREINSWLQQSPSGKAKILLIENIERMSISAINAFLKTCEEPLPNRIILATTANKSQILETIISRSITISFDSKDLIFKNDLTSELENVVKTLASNENIHNKHSFLVDINKRWLIWPFLDQLIANYISKKDFTNADKRLKVKKMSQVNINMDNLLFYWILD